MALLEKQLAFISLGGPVVIILIAMSVIGLAIFFYKLIELRQFSNAKLTSLEELVAARTNNATDRSLTPPDEPLPLLVWQAIQWLDGGEYEEELIREELQLRGRELLNKATSLQGFLEQIVLLAPLLGLLGTVLGIIDVFQDIAVSEVGGQSSSLAGGIWEALLTTAMGMAVAIPFSILHWYLSSRTGSIAVRMEGLFTQLFTGELYSKDTAGESRAVG